MAANLLRPDRQLATTPGYDDAGDRVALWRTEFVLRGELIDATPWTPRVRQAIGDGILAERQTAELPDYFPSYHQARRNFAA